MGILQSKIDIKGSETLLKINEESVRLVSYSSWPDWIAITSAKWSGLPRLERDGPKQILQLRRSAQIFHHEGSAWV